MAQDLTEEALHFDLRALCDRFGYTFAEDEAGLVDAIAKTVTLASGAILAYDLCSLDVGIRPREIEASAEARDAVVYLKPIALFIDAWKSFTRDVQGTTPKSVPKAIAVVGGGPAAFEVAVACKRRFASQKSSVHIITGNRGFLPDEARGTARLARASLASLGITLFEGVPVAGFDAQGAVLGDGTRVPCDVSCVATSAAPPRLFEASGLPLGDSGFVRVTATLNVEGLTTLFAVGDCAEFLPRPLPKAGVFAVRQGPVLLRNLQRLLRGKEPLEAYGPQARYLKIMVSGEREAIASYGRISVKGKVAWVLKQAIDALFMRRFR